MEFLVLLACLTGKGCTESTALYADLNPNMVSNVRRLEVNVKKKVGPAVVHVIAPIVGLVAGQTAISSFGHGLSLKYSKSNIVLNFERSF